MSRRVLDAAIVVVAAAVLLIVALGGIDYGGSIARIRLHSVSRPLVILVILLALRLWLLPRAAAGYQVAKLGLMSIVLAACAVCATFHVRVCGGLDSYGYVSTASLLASGHLTQAEPLVQYLPFERAADAAAPLGYIAGLDGRSSVPRFPLGLPAVMAIFRVLGDKGPFFVPLLMGYAAIAIAFLLAGGPAMFAGFLAAALVAIDPLFVDYAIQPMSDVPSAAWLLGAVWFRLGGFPDGGSNTAGSKRTRPTAAGICAAMAFLTRPALLPAAIAVGIVAFDRPMREHVKFAVPVAAALALQMALNTILYGSARMSGYGPASYMFELSWQRLTANASNFGTWMTHSHTLAFWVLWPAAITVLRRSRWAWQVSAIAAAATAPYLFYLVFNDWESSRFVLPAILLVLVLAAIAAAELARPAINVTTPIIFVIVLVIAGASHTFLSNEGVYRFAMLEEKYPLAGTWIKSHTPERAVIFAGLHSGSLRFYGARQTIRWDQIPSDKLSATLRNLDDAGYSTYLALDVASEPPLFEERFRGDPAVRIEPLGRVRVVNFYRLMSTR